MFIRFWVTPKLVRLPKTFPCGMIATSVVRQICFVLAPFLALTTSAFDIDPINSRMVNYLQSNLGTQIGSGECAHVASEALRVGGGEFIHSLIGNDNPTAGDYVWGKLIAGFKVVRGRIDGNASAKPQPGDVIQYNDVKLSNGASYKHHTSVIASVDSNGAPLEVYEENINGKRYLQRNKLDLSKMTNGAVYIYHPISRINVTARRQYSVVNRSSNNASRTLTIKAGTTQVSSFTLDRPNTSGGYTDATRTTASASTKLYLVTSSGSSVELIDGAGYEVIGGSTPTIRRLNP